MPYVPYAEQEVAVIRVDSFVTEIERTLLLRQGRVYYSGSINESGVYQVASQLEFAASELLRLSITNYPEKDEARAVLPIDPDVYFSNCPPRLELILDTAGGQVEPGLALIEHMHRISQYYRLPIDVRIAGRGMSMGTVILQGAPGKRIIGPFTILHYHGLRLNGEKPGKKKILHPDDAKHVHDLETMICTLFATRSNSGNQDDHQIETWRHRLYGFEQTGRDTFLNATEAQKLGLVDEVATVGWWLSKL